jgi:hypothetical protein
VRTFGRWASDTVVRYLGETHVSDLASTRRRLTRERGLLECAPLEAPAASGPSMCTAAELERLVEQAVSSRICEVSSRIDALRELARPSYDLILYERYKRVRVLSGGLEAPAVAWQAQCGWKFAFVPGWRLAASASFRMSADWKPCTRCRVPDEVVGM